MDVIELYDNTGRPSGYTPGTPMYSDIPESLTATLFPSSDLPISAFIEFSKHPEHPTINFYDLDAQLFGSGAKVGKRHHNTRNSLLLTESAGGDEEIEDDESSSWLDNAEESSTTRNNADFDVESKIDMSTEGLLAVLAEASPGSTHKGKGKAKAEAEEIEGNDNVNNKWPEVWE
ncbi:hypothetical protein BD769DRAFT_1780456 [Suillus cothurnatus]|nr:hypothetical protein BD769DRAFT_1780456 [Suillus cothurnatus]